MLTAYAQENIDTVNLLDFMTRRRVADLSGDLVEAVIMKYRESTIEAARIPADWWKADCALADNGI